MVTKANGAELASEPAAKTVWEAETEKNFDVLRKEIERRKDVNCIVDMKAAIVQQQIKFDRPDLIPVANMLAKLVGVGGECRQPAKQRAAEFADQFYRRQAESETRRDAVRLREHVADLEAKIAAATEAIPRLEDELANAITANEPERLPAIRQELANAETTILVIRREIDIANRLAAEALQRCRGEDDRIRHEVLTELVNVAADAAVVANREFSAWLAERPELRELLGQWKSAALLLDFVLKNMHGDSWLNVSSMDYIAHE